MVEAFLDEETNDAVGVEDEVCTAGVFIANHPGGSQEVCLVGHVLLQARSPSSFFLHQLNRQAIMAFLFSCIFPLSLSFHSSSSGSKHQTNVNNAINCGVCGRICTFFTSTGFETVASGFLPSDLYRRSISPLSLSGPLMQAAFLV